MHRNRLDSASDVQRRAIGYVRISLEDEVKVKARSRTGGEVEGQKVSIDAQKAAIETYCQLRELELIDILVDEGVSAGTEVYSRPRGKQLIDRVGVEAANVVAYKLDRLFRNTENCLRVVGEWDRRDVVLHLTSQGGTSLDTRSAMGRFFLTLLAGVAEMERNLTRERVTTAMRHKKSSGHLVGAVPYGFRADRQYDSEGKVIPPVKLVPDEVEQAVIRRILSLRFEGKSLRAITNRLNFEGSALPRGKQWHLSTVANILSQERERGNA